MPPSRRLRIFTLAFLGLVAGVDSARAWPRYFEFGGTVASLSSPSPLFQAQGHAASTSASGSFGVPLTLGLQLQDRQNGLLFSLALQARYLSGSSGAGEAYTALPIAPTFRLEFWRLVLGVGYTPYVYEGLSFRKTGAIDSVLVLEGQFLFPITPEIDFGLQAARSAYSSARYGDGPTVMEYGAFFRLNFGMSEAATAERKKFKGWRYPLGSPLR